MASTGVQALLERCDLAHLDLHAGGPDPQDGGEANVIGHLVERRRIQKIWGTQLCVLDDMMSFIERLESPDQLLNEPCPPNPGSEARGRWKALKAEYRQNLQEAETLISTLLSKIQQLHLKRDQVTKLVKTLEEKREESQQLEQSLQAARKVLRACEGQLTQTRAETDAVLTQLNQWQLYRDEQQVYVSAMQGVMQYRLLSVSQSELCVEMRPHRYGSSSSSSSSSGQLEPLKLAVTWGHDDRFCLQVYRGTTGLLEESVRGRLSELSATLLEVMENHGEMLVEIQALHSRFAIDWQPGPRRLVYLKSAAPSVVCTLAVEEGYPSGGRATLVSVRRDAQTVGSQDLQHPKEVPSLTEWLEFLSSSAHV